MPSLLEEGGGGRAGQNEATLLPRPCSVDPPRAFACGLHACRVVGFLSCFGRALECAQQSDPGFACRLGEGKSATEGRYFFPLNRSEHRQGVSVQCGGVLVSLSSEVVWVVTNNSASCELAERVCGKVGWM